ncbi:energy-coupling factor transporter transmembrane protein EcfT [Roseibium porphyridii]|uniref:Energy-coupling factor transporter transmembrane protein EcfT n=2 Tax=Roseibium porphyridii TaxID=2866279 RepID=A0ABY8F3G1_9HYPH|nr:energy-coupling factor transporter transmembrane protein EcfT [Roseibium sp. KMA01]WFE90022.1 energy-coupling factor transporter transmembrane protein EcfT [Roseibium sp. KMA01]
MIAMQIPGDTWAHRLPAGPKLVAVAVASIVLFQVTWFWVLLPCLAVVICLYASLGRQGLARLKLLRGLSVLLACLLALHWLSGTLLEGFAIILRLLVMILAANFVSVTTRMDDMMAAVQPLFRPLEWFGVSSRKPALGVTLVLRFTPYMLQVFSVLREAYRARTGSTGSWRLLAPFAIQSLRMSDHVAEALKARGGSNGLTR